MAIFEIPLVAAPQAFTISMGGVDRRIKARWCPPASAWVIDIETPDGEQVLVGLPLVTGADLFAPHADLDLGGQLIVVGVPTQSDPNPPPTLDDLGSTSHVYFVTP